jgi:cell division protease FtsH
MDLIANKTRFFVKRSSPSMRVRVCMRALPLITSPQSPPAIVRYISAPIQTPSKQPLYKIATAPSIYNEDESVEVDEETEIPSAPTPIPLPYKVLNFVIQNFFTLIIFGIIVSSFVSQREAITKQSRFFNSNVKEINPEDVTTTFADVAGVENAKYELMEIVEFLKNPEKFNKMGAKIPKGCLLYSEPGNGKTLLARSVAGEAGVPFFACSASEFVEMFVGMGAKRIRDLFNKANTVAPCIIFIDELDAIGKARSGSGGFGSNDEREQTINQLLTEMDGFTPNKGIIVIAATNRPDILDKALIRPGRFDRQIALDPPTLKDREAILNIHCRGKPLDPDFNVMDVAKITTGLSGAELANIANEAAILAARRDASIIQFEDFSNAIDRVLLGPVRKNAIVSDKKKRIVAVHEAGHTLVALKVGEYDCLTKVTITPRGKTGGVTMFEPSVEDADTGLHTKKYLENRLAVALGGRAAEAIILGEDNITTGAYGDMETVYKLARAMVTNYGFNETLGPVSWLSDSSFGAPSNSVIVNNKIDKEMMKLAQNAYKRAKIIIESNMKLFTAIAEQLYTREVLTKEDIDAIVEQYETKKKN